MSNDEVKVIIENIINDLKSKSGFKGVYLFGSRTGNAWTEDSDLDLLLAFDKDLSWQEKREVKNIIFDRELQYNFLLDAKIYNIGDINNPKTPFREVINNHAVFYAI